MTAFICLRLQDTKTCEI